MSYACTVEPLRAANLLARRPLYDVIHFGDGAQVGSSGAASVAASQRVGDMPALDLLMVIAGGDPASFRDPEALGWLKRMARRGVQLGGVSGGPVILAMAGLMEGRRMTVHWEHAPVLAEMSPGLVVERRLYVIDRDRVTCGGGTAPLDLMHALISEHHGGAFARLVSDWFLHTRIRASADPQRSGLVERIGTSSAPILDAVSAMEDHVADPLSLPQLAAIAGVSARQLNRLFRDRFGQSTMTYYRAIRLDVAQHLLGASPLPLTEIALATGFAGSAHFSRAFSERYGMPPSKVRR
ncbi:HTH-type transcriptional regulator CdhR [Defluviimonas aquaemixtae]|uniref:HTH-type transcriptional regulator CdhR n=1 Tax=Albidovulum aquaemixtae TaxID=1542388 RepID=A0A2R8B6L3_9RHOB|nr:GlxA family transcriptional regulator [Defluviimonas aquaemixtae]SPH18163.1 HTH-type transcriptional regulator CdhR [Defluviimonas aquaemixtae]